MIPTGTRMGPYEIVGPLGAGGMGEVYRARDTQLNRDVAIKVLPELFAADHERVARFTREAQTLAALNRSNMRRSMVSNASRLEPAHADFSRLRGVLPSHVRAGCSKGFSSRNEPHRLR